MDYKYIEQLLERYWQCETSLEEESELRAFFSKGEIPAHLLQYKDLFVYQQVQRETGLGEDFDARILAQVEPPVVKARRLTNETLDYNYDTYTDTYDDPEVAYKQVSSALMMLSEGINKSQDQNLADSVRLGGVDMINE